MDESLITKYPDLERQHFWWATRRALVVHLLDDLGAGFGSSVLDVGCGSGVTAEEVAAHGSEVIGVDLETHGHSHIGPVRLIEGDYLQLASDLGQFDFVLALDSVEHFPDEAVVLGALATNVKRGGYLIVTVPAYQWLWSSHDDENIHYRRYTASRLRLALQGAGFEVERLGYAFLSLTAPKAVLAGVEKVTGRSGPTGTDVGGAANDLAARYFGFETRWAQRRRNFLPFGTSVIAVARRLP